ncbi:MAG: hypothetical protein Kow0047_26300 [Anaerolineae bacterium]
MKRHLNSLLWAICALLLLPLALTLRATRAQADEAYVDYRPGELFIAFAPGTSDEAQTMILNRIGARVLHRFDHLGLLLISVPPGREAFQAAALRERPEIAAVSLNYVIRAAAEPNDPLFDLQWNLGLVSAPTAWDLIRDAEPAIVAVVDSGVDLSQPDIAETLWIHPGESVEDPQGHRVCAPNGLDDDGNGYVDDCFGWDWIEDDNEPQDRHGHGTMVTGLAAAATDNGVSMAGAGWGIRHLPLRILDERGNGVTSDLLMALEYLERLPTRPIVVNLSLAASADSAAMRMGVEHALSAGLILVAASGNDGVPWVSYPAAYAGVIAVGATDARDQRWSHSNYGSALDLAAPGANVLSLEPGGEYVIGSGTSFATPHVSAAAALLLSAAPDRTAAEIRDLLCASADDVNGDQFPGPDIWIGCGRLNMAQAIEELISTQTLTLTAGDIDWAPEPRAVVTATITTDRGVSAGSGLRVRWDATGGAITPETGISQDGVVTATLSIDPLAHAAVVTATLGPLVSTTPIPLELFQAHTIDLVVTPSVLTTEEGPSPRALVQATARNVMGAPVPDGTKIRFSTDLGSVEPTEAVTHQGTAEATLLAGATGGIAHVTADATTASAGTLAQIVAGGQPYTITIEVPPTPVIAGSQPITLTARAVDFRGQPASGFPIEWAVTAGDVEPLAAATDVDGVVEAMFYPSPRAGIVTIAARWEMVQATATTAVVAGPPASVELDVPGSEFNVGSIVDVAVRAADRWGNPVADGTPVKLAVTAGSVIPRVGTLIGGQATARWLVGETPGTATITATIDGGLTASEQVMLTAGRLVGLRLTAGAAICRVGADPIPIIVQGWDPTGQPADEGTPVLLVSDRGALGIDGQGSTVEVLLHEGRANTLFWPPTDPGVAHIEARGANGALAATMIRVHAGPPASITVDLIPGIVEAGRQVLAQAFVRDRFGNVVADGTQVVMAIEGSGAPAQIGLTQDGLAEVTFVAPMAPGRWGVVARAGEAQAAAGLIVVRRASYAPLIVR